MKNRTCCFTGHRDIPASELPYIAERLREEIVSLINNDVIYYGAGGALGFDTLASQTVLKLKKDYPNIKLILVLPCRSQTKGWSKKDIEEYERIKRLCDKCVYTSEEYTYGCMQKRNRHLVDHSGHCICYLNKSHGGTYYTVSYADSQGLDIINIAR